MQCCHVRECRYTSESFPKVGSQCAFATSFQSTTQQNLWRCCFWKTHSVRKLSVALKNTLHKKPLSTKRSLALNVDVKNRFWQECFWQCNMIQCFRPQIDSAPNSTHLSCRSPPRLRKARRRRAGLENETKNRLRGTNQMGMSLFLTRTPFSNYYAVSGQWLVRKNILPWW